MRVHLPIQSFRCSTEIRSQLEITVAKVNPEMRCAINGI